MSKIFFQDILHQNYSLFFLADYPAMFGKLLSALYLIQRQAGLVRFLVGEASRRQKNDSFGKRKT